MLSLEDCLALSDLNEAEVLEIAHHERLPEIAAAELGSYLVRTPAGEFRLDDRFIPPCLNIGASRALQAMTRRVLERLVTKSLSLWDRTRHLPRGQAALSAADVVSLWLQQTVNAFIPVLRKHDAAGKAHPESLHETLSMLAGQLSALPTGFDLHPRALPTYDHENATSAFAALDRAISRMLEEEIEANYTDIPLVRRDDLYVARLADAGMLDDAVFYLIAGGVAPGGERTVPDQLRVAAPAAMAGVRSTFSRALPLGWEPRPPTGTPDGKIPPNTDLLFDIHVVQVVPNAALMAGGGAPPGQ